MKFAEHKKNLIDYYAARASYYDLTYEIPEIQDDLAAIGARLKPHFAGRRVLEVGCGTGYWTRILSETAESVLATDPAEETLEIARAKTYPRNNVDFRKEDAFQLAPVEGEFTAGFHFRLISHVPKSRVKKLLASHHAKLRPGAAVAFGDDRGAGFTALDREGNMGHVRKVKDGRSFPIIKNPLTEKHLREILDGVAHHIRYTANEYFWLIEYELLTEDEAGDSVAPGAPRR
ncbi:MAG: class I SAM-dependent methyltransferase [Planctomycetota bacterium]|jgi:demethylmenaquinone methyltransferase/2-methoxy-6-polyprenyl-1,4-benzoquinol methylase